MSEAGAGEVTALLGRVREGDATARADLIALIYDDLRRIAGGLLRGERADHTLEPHALVHEAVIRLLQGDALERGGGRRQVYAAASLAMRQVLVDHARRRNASKRGGRNARVPLDEVLADFDRRGLDVLALDEAIERLLVLNERQGMVVVLRFFAGMTSAEVAETLEVSVGTVEGDWRLARAWLRSQLDEASHGT